MNQVASHLAYVQMELMQTQAWSAAALFHEQSKRQPHLLPPLLTHFDPKLLPDFSRRAFKEYALLPRIQLPEAQPLPVSLDRLIRERRTVRAFTNQAVMLEKTAVQLALSYQMIKSEMPKRPVPSGGGLYPLELYIASLNIEGIDQGLYHYHPAHHALEMLSNEPPLPSLEHSFMPGSLPAGAAYVLCICGILPRNRFKYGEVGYRLMLLEAGHLAQNVLLVAEAQGLGALPFCGFYDDRMHDYLQVDGIDEVCLYLLIIGHPELP